LNPDSLEPLASRNAELREPTSVVRTRGIWRQSALCIAAIAMVCVSGCTPMKSFTSPPKSGYVVGNSYQINGTWYRPAEEYSYSRTGIASYYGGERRGANFHGRLTANGERYDMNALTAAHQTLPMPSLVRVTNLENRRSVVVRINDRGPFIRGRIIDVSRRAAQLLGFEQSGLARVRVEILAEESRALKEALLRGGPVPVRMDRPPGIAADAPQRSAADLEIRPHVAVD
jgi:rare lipoprotein A